MNYEQKLEIVRSSPAYKKIEAHPNLDDTVLLEFEKECIKGNNFLREDDPRLETVETAFVWDDSDKGHKYWDIIYRLVDR